MSEDERLVIDNGSGSLRIGCAGNDTPNHTLRSTIGDANNMETNWEKWEELMWHTYSQMNVESSERAVLMTEPVMQSKQHREKMTQTMFEMFSVPAFYSMFQEVASSIASGNTTSFVVSSGYEQTYLVPVYEGIALPHAMNTLNLGGKHATEYLFKMLKQDGIEIPGEDEFSKFELVNSIKETLGFSNEYPEHIDPNSFKTFELPDKTKIEIKERHLANCAHLLFDPSLIGIHRDGFCEMLNNSFKNLNLDFRMALNSKFLLCGGNTMFTDLEFLLHNFILRALPENIYRVKKASEGVLSSWIGGSIVASLSTFETSAIYKQEYEEIGPCVIHRKCF